MVIEQKNYGFISKLNLVKAGDVLEIGLPCSEFFLNINDKHERPLVLLAADIGITPILSILKVATQSMPDREIIVVIMPY